MENSTSEEELTVTMKEQVTNLLGGFLEKHKNYAIEIYISNGISDSRVARLFVTSNRKFEVKESKCIVEWQFGEIDSNDITFPYDEILDCYVGYLEPDMRTMLFQEDIIVAMKNGMKYQFQCVGIPV